MTTLQTIINILPVDPREAVVATVLGIALGRHLARTRQWNTTFALVVWGLFYVALVQDGWHPIFVVFGGAQMLGFWWVMGGLGLSLPSWPRHSQRRQPERIQPATELPAPPRPSVAPDLNSLRQQMRDDDRREQRLQEMADLRRQGTAGTGGRGARR